ncbi:unnamed protein product [Staurois parvus]|uniref:NADH dehydrogenase subunit 1 n=1 Tax=Staurois parvus TaxID=386267 RepID=A0ABN9HIJ6_9NEOB|nr:unnamed protein product [Staurois parvus]
MLASPGPESLKGPLYEPPIVLLLSPIATYSAYVPLSGSPPTLMVWIPFFLS